MHTPRNHVVDIVYSELDMIQRCAHTGRHLGNGACAVKQTFFLAPYHCNYSIVASRNIIVQYIKHQIDNVVL